MPHATFEMIKLMLAYLLESVPLPTFVQVGACDGISGDPAHEFIVLGRIKALLIEPIEQSFIKLKRTYDGVPNVTVVHAAVGTADGKATLYRVKEGAISLDAFWASQLASFSRSHLINHGVATQDIEEVEVPCLTLETLVGKYGFNRINLLQIDTEGFDAEVVKMALNLPMLPEGINFENIHLTGEATAEIFTRLKASGYIWTHDRWDTLAIHETLAKRWVSPAISRVAAPQSIQL